MSDQKILTASQIRYLLAMKELDSGGNGVRGVTMASALGFSKPSVHTMINTFRDMGLIQKNSYGTAHFTVDGLDIVTRYSQYFDVLYRLLTLYFPPDDQLQTAIYAFLAEMSEEKLKDFCCQYKDAGCLSPLQQAVETV